MTKNTDGYESPRIRSGFGQFAQGVGVEQFDLGEGGLSNQFAPLELGNGAANSFDSEPEIVGDIATGHRQLNRACRSAAALLALRKMQ